MGLVGYVRNLPDGAVEVLAEGKRELLEELVGYIKVGPSAARVEEIVTRWSEYTGEYTSFNVRY